jgi:ligand-binding sensor domain-containing protein/DNA-binding CsgD family transcriptional regulator
MNYLKNVPVLILFLLKISAFAQAPLALPQIINYSYGQYKGGIQNWDVAQDANGILYFGNNDGLLSFNGRFWTIYHLPNFTVVRSVEVDALNRIFVGGQDEAGYFFPDAHGVLTYHSLIGLLPLKERKFADVWNIVIRGDEVFFRTLNKILHFKDNRMRVYKPETQWDFMGEANNQVFAQAKDKGLMIFNNGSWKPLHPAGDWSRSSITSMLKYNGDTVLMSTLKNGLFTLVGNQIKPFKTDVDQIFFNDRIYCAVPVNKDWYAFGSTSAGILIMNKKGRLLQRYTYEEGLQKDNIRGLWIDKNKSLWAALDDGIDLVGINNAIKTVFPDKNKQATGYAINLFKNTLYVGTSNGLYASAIDPLEKDISLSKRAFYEVKNAKGQVWGLQEINNQLLMGHEDGFFTIEGGQAKRISTSGTWLFNPVSWVYPVKDVIAGNYYGLQHLVFRNGKFEDKGQLSGYTDSFRFLDFDSDENTAWVSHPNWGIYKMKLSADYNKILKTKIYNKNNGLPSSLHNYLYRIKNRRVIATERGIYEYDAAADSFKPSSLFNRVLKDIPIQYLKEDNEGNVWFISNKKVGIIDITGATESKPFTVIYLPELNEKVVGGFESIYALNNENVFIGASKGAFHINYKKYKENKFSSTILLGQVKLFGKKDSILFGGYFMKKGHLSAFQDPDELVQLPHYLNALHFEYSSTLFEQQNNIEFSFQLKGFDKNWSAWSAKSEKDYTNLSPGDYTFRIKSRNNLGSESPVLEYSFTIWPAWYRSVWAYLIYGMVLVLSVFFIFKWQKLKYHKEQEKLNYLHQLETDRNEKQIAHLKNEKLEAEVDFKNRELATMTMHLVQRGKVLIRIKEVISSLVKRQDTQDSAQSFRHLLRLIREVEKSDEDKDQFTLHFNHINEQFFNRLKDRYPDLTPNELKLCAYLKMNLSTKEIAQLMNITIKAVEVGRYRLRKKLQLQPDTNLYDFLMQLSRAVDSY